MPEPITTVGITAIAAYLGKDGVSKILGPTADYLGGEIKAFTERRVENVGKIFSNAEKKLGDKLDSSGKVPPKVLKTIINEGSYSDDPVALEYFGGVLASSRTDIGRDNRGARLAKIIDNLSTYQLRTHYLIYSTISNIFLNQGAKLNLSKDREEMKIFLPFAGYIDSMGFDQAEVDNPQIMSHIWHGLFSDNLIEGQFQYGDKASLIKISPNVPGDGILCQPSVLGMELFLWAFGYGDKEINFSLGNTLDASIEGLPNTVAESVAL